MHNLIRGKKKKETTGIVKVDQSDSSESPIKHKPIAAIFFRVSTPPILVYLYSSPTGIWIIELSRTMSSRKLLSASWISCRRNLKIHRPQISHPLMWHIMIHSSPQRPDKSRRRERRRGSRQSRMGLNSLKNQLQ